MYELFIGSLGLMLGLIIILIVAIVVGLIFKGTLQLAGWETPGCSAGVTISFIIGAVLYFAFKIGASVLA